MKHLLTLIFALSILSASAQYTASINKVKSNNNLCAERGHNVTYKKNTIIRSPYTIDTKDSTVTVYPVSNASTGRCSRCGAEIENLEKEIRVTTWRRVEKAVKPSNASSTSTALPLAVKSTNFDDDINWGNNDNRAVAKAFKSTTLNEIKKVATLRNDTLFIHKRIAPFTSLKEQTNTTKTVTYNNKSLVFKTVVFDEAAFYGGNKSGLEIF